MRCLPLVFLVAASCFAQEQPTVTVEVLGVKKIREWSEPSLWGNHINNTHRRRVTVNFKMPDGSILLATCRGRSCPEPEPGEYRARIGKHNIHLLFSAETKRAEYNSNGTLKTPAEFKIKEAKFTF